MIGELPTPKRREGTVPTHSTAPPHQENVSTFDFRIIGQLISSPSIVTSQVSTHQLPELDAPSALPTLFFVAKTVDYRRMRLRPFLPDARLPVGRAFLSLAERHRASSALGEGFNLRALAADCGGMPRSSPPSGRIFVLNPVVDRPRDPHPVATGGDGRRSPRRNRRQRVRRKRLTCQRHSSPTITSLRKKPSSLPTRLIVEFPEA